MLLRKESKSSSKARGVRYNAPMNESDEAVPGMLSKAIDWLRKLFSRDYRIFGALRSSHWSSVRTAHIKAHPLCEICGKDKGLNVHHIKPFHIRPELELDPTNLITLCESGGMNCHITFGHLGNFHSFNENVVEDVRVWRTKVQGRPLGVVIDSMIVREIENKSRPI